MNSQYSSLLIGEEKLSLTQREHAADNVADEVMALEHGQVDAAGARLGDAATDQDEPECP